MNKGKPRGPTPSLIGGTNGRPRRVDVRKRCKCSRCHCALEMGTECFEIPKVGGAFASARRVCSNCFQTVLQKTQDDLEELRRL